MTPADILRPFLLEADRRKPDLRVDNRFPSCFELLDDTITLGNAAAIAAGRAPDWQYIGKTTAGDGAAFRPAWFTPVPVECTRPDGQRQTVLIDGLGMDAVWYMPTREQVKVLVNSTANELPIGDSRRGPARLDPYLIPKFNPDTNELQWRWHNPPMPQRAGVVVTPMPPTPVPTPSQGTSALPDRGEMMRAGQELHRYYKSPEGLQRPDGLWKPESRESVAQPDWEGIGAWLFDVYLKARVAGKNATEAMQAVIAEIRKSGEWQSKHPGETP